MPQKSDENQIKNQALKLLNFEPKTPCPFCEGQNTAKAGQRVKREGTVQKYFCKICKKYFSSSPMPHKTYSPKVILNGITYYNLGYKLDATCKKLNSQFKQKVPKGTLHSWIKQYEGICTFTKYRRKLSFSPEEVITEKVFKHHQEYAFKFHRLKLNILVKKFPQIRKYLWQIYKSCPDEIFEQGQRCSGTIIENVHLRRERTKDNNAVLLARLALLLAKRNKDRHPTIQDFMLKNDTATVAVEVPVYLYPNEVQELGIKEPICGHIDFLQIRWDKVWILDYKPDAKFNPVKSLHQIYLYKLALSKRTGIPLKSICAAYFDGKDYFELKEN